MPILGHSSTKSKGTMTRFLRWLAPLLLLGASFLPQTQAQLAQSNTGDAASSDKGERAPVAQYALVILFTFFVLVIVCKPSRKA
jgi:hypothetical protein